MALMASSSTPSLASSDVNPLAQYTIDVEHEDYGLLQDPENHHSY